MVARQLIPLVVVALSLLASLSSPAAATVSCDKVTSTAGSDSAAGTAAAPYRTLQKLANSLSAGQTGCLRQGTYSEPNVKVVNAGSASARITITSYPGERATHVGRLWVADSANFVTISNLNLDGSGAPACAAGGTCAVLPSPVINGDDVTFEDTDVTNRHNAICFNAGSPTYGRAYRLTIQRNRIHDCGRIPVTNHEHGIYLQRTNDARILNNLIYDNADRGIQFYPDAQGSYVAGNVIDGNGEGVDISGDYGVASNDNLVEHNLITNSNQSENLYSWYPAGNPVGTGNVVRDNCIHGGVKDNGDGGISTAYGGFTLGNNLLVDPLYVDRATKNFALRSGSPCAALMGGTSGESTGGTVPTPSVNSAPTVDLTSPVAGASLGGNLSMVATASDDTRVAKVEFWVDSRLVASDATAPYSYSMRTKTLSRGSHTVTAKAFDDQGLTAQDSATVTR